MRRVGRSWLARIHVGADISTLAKPNQAYAGFSWTFDLNVSGFSWKPVWVQRERWKA